MRVVPAQQKESTFSIGSMSEMSGATALWIGSSRTSSTGATTHQRRSKNDGHNPLLRMGGGNHNYVNDTDDTTSTCDTEMSSDVYTDHTSHSTIENIVEHLSPSNHTDINVAGLTLLLDTIETEGQQWLDSPPSVSDTALAILYGVEQDEDPDNVQRLVGSFIYGEEEEEEEEVRYGNKDNASSNRHKDDDDRSFYSLPAKWNDDDIYYKDDDHLDDDSQGSDDDNVATSGSKKDQTASALKVRALQVISKSLHQLLLAEEEDEDAMMTLRPLDFAGSAFWKRVIGSLIENLQNFDSIHPDVVEHSLTVLRLLHTMDPHFMTPVLNYILLPYLSEIKEYAIEKKLVAIASEADRVLNFQRSECYGVEV